MPPIALPAQDLSGAFRIQRSTVRSEMSKPSISEFAMNARRTPGRVLGHHAEDELAQFLVHAFSSCMFAMPREPRPVELEASSMPANDSLRLNENQSSLPSRPEAPQHHPEESIGIGKPWPRAMSREDQYLLPQSQVFQEKMMA